MPIDPLKFGDRASASIIRAPSGLILPVQKLHLAGIFTVWCYDRRGRLRWRDICPNLIVSAGLNYTLGVSLVAQAQVSVWYMGLVDNAGFTAFNASDTMAVHPGWAENTQYSGGARPVWTPGAPSSSNTVVNSTTVNFVMSTGATIRGMFIVSDNTLGGTAGTLYSEAAFSAGNQTASPGDTLRSTYQVSASSP